MKAYGASWSRRDALRCTGALIVGFSLDPRSWSAGQDDGRSTASLPGSLARTPGLDAWIRIDSSGHVTAFTGKAELGQGIRTALAQIVCEELAVPLQGLTLITADTARTPDEGFTAGSHSIQDSGTALRNAAAQVREILIASAARRLRVAGSELRAENSAVVARNGARLSYAELVAAGDWRVAAKPVSRLKDPSQFTIMNHPVGRVDIPAKVVGETAFVQDLRLPGMLHARVVRPPAYGATLISVDATSVEGMPGVVKVIRDGDFLAVVAAREYQAIKAMRALESGAKWRPGPGMPDESRIQEVLHGLPSQALEILDRHAAGTAATAGTVLIATYTRPYIAHASLGPSCAVAHMADGIMSVWTHSQGVFPARRAIAQLLGLREENVHCIHVQGSGCYGHNGADDAAADAAIIAAALPDHPVRVQWMREQEHAWEPFGAAMSATVRAVLGPGGRIASWDYGVWTNTHAMRPGPAGSLLAGQLITQHFQPQEPQPLPQPEGGGDRNAVPLYTIPDARVTHHFIPSMPVRVSALRSLGAHLNVFAIESLMDELSQAAELDPVEFRLRHLDDARAREVIGAAAEDFRWRERARAAGGHGCGFAFARYKNLAAYCALAMQVRVERESGVVRVLRIAAAVDTGQIVNPDGVRNQIEGGIIQSLSWALFERVRFDTRRITSTDWASYPILRFDAVPDSLTVRLLDRPGSEFLGCGEAAQ